MSSKKCNEWPNEADSIDELFSQLASWSPVVREYAAQALGKTDEDLVDELIALLRYGKGTNLRRGAAMGLAYAGRGSEKAVDALIHTLETSDDQVLKHFVVRAFKGPRSGNGIGTSDAIGKAIPVLLKHATIEDPADPWNNQGSQIHCPVSERKGPQNGEGIVGILPNQNAALEQAGF